MLFSYNMRRYGISNSFALDYKCDKTNLLHKFKKKGERSMEIIVKKELGLDVNCADDKNGNCSC